MLKYDLNWALWRSSVIRDTKSSLFFRKQAKIVPLILKHPYASSGVLPRQAKVCNRNGAH